MRKQLIGICLAICSAAAVVPATAAAVNDPQLTQPTGTLLGTGAPIHAANVGTVRFTGNDTKTVLVECTVGTLTGTLTKNSSSTIEATIESAITKGPLGPKEACASSLYGAALIKWNPATNGVPWCLRSTSSMATNELQIRGNSCSESSRPIRFILDRENFQCTYELNSLTKVFSGTFKTHPEDAVWTVVSTVPFARFEGGVLCTNFFYIDMTLTFGTEGKPLYIS